MKELKWALIAVGLVAIAGFLAYSLVVSERLRQEALIQAETAALDAEAESLDRRESGEMEITLYFYNPGALPGSAKFLRPEIRKIVRLEEPAALARQIVLELGKGPTPESISGDPALLQPEETLSSFYANLKLRQVYLVDSSTAAVDLEASPRLPGGIINELALIESVTRSIRANLPQIVEVRFLVDGKGNATLGAHVSLARPFR